MDAEWTGSVVWVIDALCVLCCQTHRRTDRPVSVCMNCTCMCVDSYERVCLFVSCNFS